MRIRKKCLLGAVLAALLVTPSVQGAERELAYLTMTGSASKFANNQRALTVVHEMATIPPDRTPSAISNADTDKHFVIYYNVATSCAAVKSFFRDAYRRAGAPNSQSVEALLAGCSKASLAPHSRAILFYSASTKTTTLSFGDGATGHSTGVGFMQSTWRIFLMDPDPKFASSLISKVKT